MSGGDFTPVLEICFFCVCLFLAGVLSKKVGVSAVIGEMAVGVLFGPNAANIVPHEEFFRLAGVFGVTLMIFESGLHVDFAMLRKVGLRASVVAVLGTFLPLVSGMLLIMVFDPERYELWPVGLAVGVTLAPTSVGMALKMLGEKKQLGEEYGQLIVTAAFVDDILSLVALTMLLQIGVSESTGEALSVVNIGKPLVLSVLFCVVGALMALPMKRTDGDGFMKRVLLRWIGVFPEFVPKLMKKAGLRGHEHHEYAKELMKEQDHILEEFGQQLQEAAGHIITAIRSQYVNSTAGAGAGGEEKGDVGSSEDPVLEAKLSETVAFIAKDIKHAQDELHSLAERRAQLEHHDEVSEEDLEQAVVHGKADLFESFLLHTAKLIQPMDATTAEVLERMAHAHNIIHEVKEGDHREQWEQRVEEAVNKHMNAWRKVHGSDGGHGGDSLAVLKEEYKCRAKVVLNYAMRHVRSAFVALKSARTGDKPRRTTSGNLLIPLARTITAEEDPDIELVENILCAKAEDKKKSGLLNIKIAVDHATCELDLIQASTSILADIWDDWMGELLVDMVATGNTVPGVIRSVEELQYLQTHLFADAKADVLGKVELNFHTRHSSKALLAEADDDSTCSSDDEDQDKEEDELFKKRMEWRSELNQEHEQENRFILTMMFGLLIGYGFIANEIGSHLLGAFIAGISFCWMNEALELWHSQVKRIANWLIRLFFGATVAFSIPISIMMDGDAIWKGFLLGLGPCILTKVVAGFTTGEDKWVVGFAMVGRGEFAYLVAQTAQDTLLNPAPESFNDPTIHFVQQPGGYWCVDGVCANATATVRRLAGSSDECSSGDGSARRFCSHCIGDDCHDAPLPGHHYWAVGEDCSKDHSCDCNMMMPADAFAICVWALVMASVLAPIGFSVFLKRRLDRKAQQADELKQSRRALRAAKAPPTEAEAAMPSTSSRP